MKYYTVIYLESWMCGSHRVTQTCKKEIMGNNYESAIENSTVDPSSVVFAFHGKLENVMEGE